MEHKLILDHTEVQDTILEDMILDHTAAMPILDHTEHKLILDHTEVQGTVISDTPASMLDRTVMKEVIHSGVKKVDTHSVDTTHITQPQQILAPKLTQELNSGVTILVLLALSAAVWVTLILTMLTQDSFQSNTETLEVDIKWLMPMEENIREDSTSSFNFESHL
jgi:hypothetical protein